MHHHRCCVSSVVAADPSPARDSHCLTCQARAKEAIVERLQPQRDG
jgi:hypothetical protein